MAQETQETQDDTQEAGAGGGGWCTCRLVQAALGLPTRPQRLTENRLLAAVEMFEAFHIEASDLLASKRRTHLRSRWLLDAVAPAKAVA